MYNIGDTIYLELFNYDDEKEAQRYRCRLVDRVNNLFYIDYPINEKTKKQDIFPNGTKFRAWFIGKDQAIYLFETEVVEHKRAQIPMLVLIDPGKTKYIRIQRRQYVRVDTAIDVAVHPIESEFDPFITITADISGGGMAILLPNCHSMVEKQEINCWLCLHMQSGEIKYINVHSKIVRIKRTKESSREKASIQFLTIAETDRQLIVRYCFERQLYLKKKGLFE